MKKGDFRRVIEDGRKFSSRYLLMQARPNGLPFSRLGIAASKKIGNAVIRNRIKRLLRESVRKQLKVTPLRCDLMITARTAASEADFAALDKIIAGFFARLANEKNLHSTDKGV